MKIFECERNTDSMSVLPYHDGTLEFTIDAPWRGSSETGFGETLEFCIDRDDAARLRDALSAWITNQNVVA